MLSMLMVVILHVLGAGGVLDATTPRSASFFFAWALEILCYCAVNTFAAISGYVGIASKHKISGIATLTLQVLFYTAALTLAIGLAFPGSLTLKEWIKGLYPFQHWYFISYFCLFFFLPLINRGLRALDRMQLLWLVGFMTVLFSLIPTALGNDLFQTARGYSPLWLGYMYVIGAALRLRGAEQKIHGRTGVLIYLGATGLTLWAKIILEAATPAIFGEVRFSNALIRYDSPTMVAAAIGLLLAFAKCNVKGFAKRLVAFLSPMAFSVYLIHEFPLLKEKIITSKFTSLASLPAVLIPFAAMGIALCIYLACTVIEIPRFYLFKGLKIKQRFQSLADWLLKKVQTVLH